MKIITVTRTTKGAEKTAKMDADHECFLIKRYIYVTFPKRIISYRYLGGQQKQIWI